jgi:RNA polymerase sigma factor (sigma-70 family)
MPTTSERTTSETGDMTLDELRAVLDEEISHLPEKYALPLVLCYLEGLTNEEIGKKIFISEKTVKTHLTNIFDKLKVNNRFKAALMLRGQSH